MPNQRRWQPQAARLLSSHLAFDILYLPGWVISGAIVTRLNYPSSQTGILIGYFILAGLALSSWSIAFASLFRKAQLSGITVTIVSIVLAIIVQVQTPESTGAIVILALLFPPMNFTLFIIYMAYWQRSNLAAVLSEAPPGSPWRVSGAVFFVLCVIQILVYPLVGAFIERALYGTASKARNMHHSADSETARITNLTKQYSPSWLYKNVWSRFSKSKRETVFAVNDVSFTIRAGEIHVLLGANGTYTYHRPRPDPTIWRFDLLVQSRLYLSHYTVVISVVEGPKRYVVQARSLWTMARHWTTLCNASGVVIVF
jgi:ATP-binding cassette subfamily A (ABC1) protein 3